MKKTTAMAATITDSTTVTAVISSRAPVAGAVTCSTAVTGTASVHILRAPAIHGATTLTALLNLNAAPSAIVVCRTTPTGTLNLAEVIQASQVSTIHARSTVSAAISRAFNLSGGTAHCATTVHVAVSYRFGATLFLRTDVHGRVGIRRGSFGSIACRTSIVAQPPANRFTGTCIGRTSILVTLTNARPVTATVTCTTTFHSHFRGHIPHDGPIGSVTLTQVPHGDLGIPDEISCSTVLVADITVERHRMLVVFGNAAVSVDRSLVVPGTAIAGTGIRQVGHPVDLPEKVRRHATFYV
jgi:hypothetical protein